MAGARPGPRSLGAQPGSVEGGTGRWGLERGLRGGGGEESEEGPVRGVAGQGRGYKGKRRGAG